MTTATQQPTVQGTAGSTGAGASPAFRALVRTESRRFARHPLVLLGFVLTAVSLATTVRAASTDLLAGAGFFPALLLGVLPMVAAYRLAGSTRPSEEALAAAPVSGAARTAAVCMACLVPAAAGAVWLVLTLVAVRVWPPAPWMYGELGSVERVVVLATESVVAALGGALLGVAAGRWLRFPGGVVVVLLAVLGWVSLGISVSLDGAPSTVARAVHLSAPFTFFADVPGTYPAIDTWPGSPTAYLVYLLALCGLAAAAAVLHDAQGALRSRLLRIGAGVLVVAVVAWVLAFSTGLDHVVRARPDGSHVAVAQG